MKKNNHPIFNIKVNQTKFENISFEQWKRLVPDVLNYDLQLNNIEQLDHLLKMKQYLTSYIDCQGVVPNQYQASLHQLEKDKELIKKIKKDQAIAEYDSNFKVLELERLNELEKKVNFNFVKDGKIDDTQPVYFYFNNPYFLNGDQKFNLRLNSLKNELDDLNWTIRKQLKPVYKKSKNMMDLIEIDMRRILNITDPNTSLRPIIDFTRPYIDDIINSDDYFYQELLARSL